VPTVLHQGSLFGRNWSSSPTFALWLPSYHQYTLSRRCVAFTRLSLRKIISQRNLLPPHYSFSIPSALPHTVITNSTLFAYMDPILNTHWNATIPHIHLTIPGSSPTPPLPRLVQMGTHMFFASTAITIFVLLIVIYAVYRLCYIPIPMFPFVHAATEVPVAELTVQLIIIILGQLFCLHLIAGLIEFPPSRPLWSTYTQFHWDSWSKHALQSGSLLWPVFTALTTYHFHPLNFLQIRSNTLETHVHPDSTACQTAQRVSKTSRVYISRLRSETPSAINELGAAQAIQSGMINQLWAKVIALAVPPSTQLATADLLTSSCSSSAHQGHQDLTPNCSTSTAAIVSRDLTNTPPLLSPHSPQPRQQTQPTGVDFVITNVIFLRQSTSSPLSNLLQQPPLTAPNQTRHRTASPSTHHGTHQIPIPSKPRFSLLYHATKPPPGEGLTCLLTLTIIPTTSCQYWLSLSPPAYAQLPILATLPQLADQYLSDPITQCCWHRCPVWDISKQTRHHWTPTG